MVARTVKSYKELPLRLYQITRKYRDEFRPRHGLLRGREFTMKDLYTFDLSEPSAMETYAAVRAAYAAIFSELELPVLVAEASSGDMGGDRSHEYHLPTALGEDDVVSCNSCDYVINNELAETRITDKAEPDCEIIAWKGISKDRRTLVHVLYPQTTRGLDGQTRTYSQEDVNVYALKSVVPDLDAGIEDAQAFWDKALETTATSLKIVSILDTRLPETFFQSLRDSHHQLLDLFLSNLPGSVDPSAIECHGRDKPLDIMSIRPGDRCPRCSSGTLSRTKAIELGHTFHLGTRYSVPLEATVSLPGTVLPRSVGSETAATAKGDDALKTCPLQMGCHGIGVSRIIGAVADHLSDDKGLNWPAVIAPYTCVIVPAREEDLEDAIRIYGEIGRRQSGHQTRHPEETGPPEPGHTYQNLVDVIIDDRMESLPRRLTDADLIGIPIIIVLGRQWRATRCAELQCRQLGIKKLVREGELIREAFHLLKDLRSSRHM